MKRDGWWSEVLDLAEEQGGMFTAAQACALGASRPQLHSLTESGTIERALHGVYQLVGTPVDRWVPLRAAWMAVDPKRSTAERLADPDGPGAVVSYRSAAQLLNLGDVDADLIEMTVPVRRETRNPQVRLRRAQIEPLDWFVREGLPVTTPAATVEMLAHDMTDPDHLGAIIRDSVLRYDVDVDEIASRLAPNVARYGYRDAEAMLEQMLTTAGAPVPSVDLSAVLAGADLEGLAASSERMRKVLEDLQRNVAASYNREVMARYSQIFSQAIEQLQPVMARSGMHEQMLKALKPAMDQFYHSLPQVPGIDVEARARVAEAAQALAYVSGSTPRKTPT
ncbi:hypothetical protein GCM10009633_24000 [Janibacter melonis]|uniref:type IV toxin-antitoxin system AbiEi family antitoxin domain-containing protein n=1 Tax=Janibacter melonis TaxID=262209 RepID=UPI001E30B04B|nr:type IV toxin-antitoxin system AbiEi family antitoxin domain-containing protein [Janibacter melonis]MCB5993228.1 type IV toxin-antitoxin system AbiEi family antitoxin domain-containing protein [Janibacter melonis]